MDAKVWSKNPIQKLAENFIPVKFDLSDGFHAASTYSVKGIPTIMILDSWGDILYQSTGYMSDSEVEKILQSFPADVERLNKALATFHEDKKNKNKLVIVALAFQEYGKESKGQGEITFLRKCDEYLNHAKKRSSKDEVVFREKVEILKALNKVYWGKENVAIKTLRDKIGIEKICKENQALANFVLTNAFIGIQDKNEAEKFFVKLKNSEGSEEFIKQIGCMFQ